MRQGSRSCARRLSRQHLLVLRHLPDGLAGLVGVLRQFGCGFVADLRRQGRTHRQAFFDEALASLFVRLDPLNTLDREVVGGCSQKLNGLKKVVGHHRHHDDQLEIRCLSTDGHRHIVPDHLRANHCDGLGDHRIDLPRHDRRTRLRLRQIDFAKSTPRP